MPRHRSILLKDWSLHQTRGASKGQWGRAWDLMRPAQQALISRDHFIQCGQKTSIPEIASVKVIETYPDHITIPGTPLEADATAVTFKLKARGNKNTETATFHAVNVDGAWRWPQNDPDSFKGSNCP